MSREERYERARARMIEASQRGDSRAFIDAKAEVEGLTEGLFGKFTEKLHPRDRSGKFREINFDPAKFPTESSAVNSLTKVLHKAKPGTRVNVANATVHVLDNGYHVAPQSAPGYQVASPRDAARVVHATSYVRGSHKSPTSKGKGGPSPMLPNGLVNPEYLRRSQSDGV